MVLALLRFRLARGDDGQRPPTPPDGRELVGAASGFVSAEVLTDAKTPDILYLATRWTDLRAFQRWVSAAGRRLAERNGTRLALDSGFRLVLFVDRAAHPNGAVATDTLAVHLPDLVGRFVSDSTSVHFLATSRSGTVLACNPVVAATLAVPPARVLGQKLWRFLPELEADRLRQWMEAGPTPRSERARLSLVDGAGAPVTLECHAVLRSDGLVLLGEPVREDGIRLQQELLQLSGRLTVLARENVRKAKALRRVAAKLRTTLEEMKGARAVWEATAMFESTIRDLERAISRLERTDESCALRR